MEDKKTIVKGGVGFPGLLTIAFIILKLCGVITWSWFWVLSPLIFAVGFVILLVVIALIISLFNN